MLEEHFDGVGPAPRSTFDLSHFLAANPTQLRWALAPKSDDGRGAARCRASVDVRFPKNHARGGNSEVRSLANLLYLYNESFDIVVDTFANGETVS